MSISETYTRAYHFKNIRPTVVQSESMSEGRKGWLRRRFRGSHTYNSSESDDSRRRRTILHAVPQTKVSCTRSVEERMANGPHHDVLIATCGQNSRPDSSLGTSPVPDLPTNEISRGTGDANLRIGTWVDGVALWEEWQMDMLTSNSTGSRPRRPGSAHSTLAQFDTTEIEGDRPDNQNIGLPRIVHPKPRKPFGPVRARCAVCVHAELSYTRLENPELQDHATLHPASTSESNHRSHASASSSSTNWTFDEKSFDSRPTSVTTVDGAFDQQHSTRIFPPIPPTDCQVFDDASLKTTSPLVDSRVRLPHTAVSFDRIQLLDQLCQCQPSSKLRQCYSEHLDSQIGAASPTLSQAEHAVRTRLYAMSHGQKSSNGQANEQRPIARGTMDLQRQFGAKENREAIERTPTIPRRSRKRDWRMTKSPTSISVSDGDLGVILRRKSVSWTYVSACVKATLPLRRMSSFPHSSKLPALPSPRLTHTFGYVASAPNIGYGKHRTHATATNDTPVPSDRAEEVLVATLAHLTSPKDLFSTSIVNKGIYMVFKKNERRLLNSVLYNESPPAYELQQWKSGEAQSYYKDLAVVEQLKKVIHDRCQDFLRQETISTLLTTTHSKTQRFDDALWRIWCFCLIFGPSKGREDDIIGQLDWLKGGALANNIDCAATINTSQDFDVASVLLNPPYYFAEANVKGLNAADLYDMSEMWSCLAVLLQGYCGHHVQARQHGMFQNQPALIPGDVVREQQILEEWTAYLLTLGPDVVLEMILAAEDPAVGFSKAMQRGWTLPRDGGSRTNFLKQVLSSMYSEQVAFAKSRVEGPVEQIQQGIYRDQPVSIAAEMLFRQRASDDMDSERSISITSRRDSAISSRPGSNGRSCYDRSINCLSPSSTSKSLRSVTMQPNLPITENRWQHVNPVPLSSLVQTPPNSTEFAVQRIVSMGFPPGAAREALRLTDDGEKLCLDRAVEYLLRQ